MTNRIIPPDATVTVNVKSYTNSLRDMATLLRCGSLPPEFLDSLADRVEEMYFQQLQKSSYCGPGPTAPID